MYQNIEIILGTKHKKEEAIRNPFETAFSATIFTPPDYDTDQFGTFTNEIPREKDPLQTAITKANTAAIKYGYQYAIANEGSFGPHPACFYLPADIEFMVFIDLKNDIIISESELSTVTNFNHLDIDQSDDYQAFLTKIQFGSHGLIIKSLDNQEILAKGITDKSELASLLKSNFKKFKRIRLETDMRAHFNPTRMAVIHTLAIKLVNRIIKTCKACSAPGFGKVSFHDRLLCQNCGTETQWHKSVNLACIKCDYSETYPRDDGLTEADPMYCQYCNP